MIRVDMKRSLLSKDLQKQCEFIVEYKVNTLASLTDDIYKYIN